MRLTDNEKKIIKNSICSLDSKAKIFLYGSRANDCLKGGDIDLLVISDFLCFKDKVTILLNIKSEIGEQKIDLSIQTQKENTKDTFFQSISALVEL